MFVFLVEHCYILIPIIIVELRSVGSNGKDGEADLVAQRPRARKLNLYAGGLVNGCCFSDLKS